MKKLIVNGRVLTMDSALPKAESVLIEDDRILAVGTNADLKAEHAHHGAEVIDAKNAVIVPGFIDAHNHFTMMGVQKFQLDLSGLKDRNAILEKIHQEHLASDPTRSIIGINYETEWLPKGQQLTENDLLQAAPGRFIQVSDRSLHMSVTTRQTLAHAGIPLIPSDCCDCKAPCPLPVTFTGEISGWTNFTLHNFMQSKLRTPEGLKAAWDHAAAVAAAHGVTSIHAIVRESEMHSLLDYQSRLPIDLRIYTETKDVKTVQAAGLKQIGGCGSVMLDGDTGPRTAAFLEPYDSLPLTYGQLYYSDQELYDYVREAHLAGLQVALHCVGDAASLQLLNVIERVQRESGKTVSHRIEHFEFGTQAQMRKAKSLGVSISIQPAFNYFWDHTTYFDILGQERALISDPVKSVADHGILIGLGSDSSVTPCDPLLTIHSAVNHSRKEERLSPAAALYYHTMGGAALGMDEAIRGSITPGKSADMVFLAADPSEVSAAEIKDIPVTTTISKGEIIYASNFTASM